MTRLSHYVLSALFGLCLASIGTGQIFEENWDDGNGAGRWSDPIVALENPPLGWDGSVDYAFDYSVLGASSAPRSQGGTTLGVAMESNTTISGDDEADQGESVGIIPLAGLADIPAGDFLIKTDMYLFWNGLGGSTEYGTLGGFSTGAATPLRFNLDNGDGLAWQVDTDGDSGTDILRYENPPGSETGLGGWEDIPAGSIPGVATGVGNPPGTILGPFNRWVDFEIESVAGMVSLRMNGYTIDTFDNSGGNFSGGTLTIGHSDPFNSVNPDDAFGNSNMAVFDNVCLTTPGTPCSVPEPTSLALLLIAGLGLAVERRR